MITKALNYVESGFKSIKMQVSHCFTNDEDVVNVKDMRSALGDDIGIMIDVNQGWGVDEAINVCKKLRNIVQNGLKNPSWLITLKDIKLFLTLQLY